LKTAQRLLIGVGFVAMITGLALLFAPVLQNLLRSFTGPGDGSGHLFKELDALAGEAIFRGLILLAAGLALPHWRKIKSFVTRQNRLIPLAMLALVIITLPVIIGGHSALFGGQRIWWLGDDAMISMRYAHNMASGLGLVWNPGERVEGYTNFLWTLLLTLLHLLPISTATTSLYVLLASLVLSLTAIRLLRRLIHLLGGGDLVLLSVLLSYVGSKNLLAWSTSGFETILLMVMVLLSACRLVEESRRQQPQLGTFLLIGVMSLVRADALLLSAIFFTIAFFTQDDKRRVVLLTIVSLILPVSHFIFRYFYYGDWLPNTAYLKTTLWPGRIRAGVTYTLGFLWHYFFLIILAIFATFRSAGKMERFLLSGFMAYLFYIAYAGGDAFGNYRFAMPMLPLLLVLGYIGIQRISSRRQVRLGLAVLCFATLPLFPLSYKAIIAPFPFDVGNINLGLILKENTPADCRVADCWGGSVFYFSERYGIDVLGKMDRIIARRPAFPGANLAGHNKFDYDYSLGVLKPDLLVANFKWPVKEEEMSRTASGNWAFVGQLYFNEYFRRYYLPNPVPLNTSRTIFVRGDSPLAGLTWHDLSH